MTAFARWYMASRWRAILVTFVTALLSPLFFWLTTSLVGLVALRAGVNQGTQILGVAVLGGILSFNIFGDPTLILLCPVVALMAFVLRRTVDWNVTLIMTVFIGLGLVIFSNVFLKQALIDFVSSFEAEFQALIRAYLSGSAEVSSEALENIVEGFKQSLPSLLAIGVTQLALGFLVIARWLQAGIYNPGGFKAEMHALRIPKQYTVLIFALSAVLWFTDSVTLTLALMPHSLAGIALVHSVKAKRDLGGWVLAVFYGLLILVGQFVFPLILVLAVIDSFVDIRKFIPPAKRESL